MKACKIKPDKLPNKDGVLTDPILYKSLMETTGNNRDLSMLIYNMVDDRFRSTYSGKLVYDEQGMPTLDSMLSIPAVKKLYDLNTGSVLDNLNKQYESGVYEYQEAIERVGAFNRNPAFNRTYMAMATRITTGENKGKFLFSITNNTAANRRAMEDAIKHEAFRERVLYALASAGVKVDFVDNLMYGVEGVYTTKSAETVFDTLYNAIRIAEGSKNKTDILTEETGHLIVGIAENNKDTKVLLDRFLNNIKNADANVLKAILINEGGYTEQAASDFISDIQNDPNVVREAAGRILAVTLDKNPSWFATKGDNFFMRMLSRMSNSVKSILTNIKKFLTYSKDKGISIDSISKNDMNLKDSIIRDAKALSAKFMNGSLGTIEDALGTPEERHHEHTLEVRVATQLVNAYNAFGKKLRNIGLDAKDARALNDRLAAAIESGDAFRQLGKHKSDPIFSKMATLQMINFMLGNIKEITQSMSDNEWQEVLSRDFSEKLENGELATIPDFNMKVKGLSRMIALVTLCKEVEDIMSPLLASNDADINNFNLPQISAELKNIVAETANAVKRINHQCFKAVMCTVNGGHNYITTSRRMTWHGVEEAKKITFDELIAGFDAEGKEILEDCSAWGVWMQKMGNSISPINQLASNLYDFNKAESNKDMYRYSQLLLDLHERIKDKLGREDTGFMLEIDENGVATGNIVQPNYNFGVWERDYQDWLRERRVEWKKYAATQNFRNKNVEHKAYFDWFKPQYEAWHKQNSQPRPENYVDELFGEEVGNLFEEHSATIHYLPAEKYRSEQWNNLSEDQKEFVKEYIKIKQSLDEFIEEYHPHSITSYRLPQFRSTTISRMMNKRYKEEEVLDASGQPTGKVKRTFKGYNGLHTLAEMWVENYFEDALDEEFGDNSTYNSEEDSFFDTSSLTDRELTQRIPVFGVNKLKDQHNISRDVIHSTMQYAAMALNVRGMNTTALVLKNGLDVISETTINGIREDKRKGAHSGVYTRYTKFLEMQVFGQKSNLEVLGTIKGRKILLNKLAGSINRHGSYLLLAGKVFSGTVNTGTGYIQLFKEAAVGEHYTGAELAKAYGEYRKAWYQRKLDKEGLKPLNASNKYDSFSMWFDSLNQNESYFRDFESHKQMNGWSQLRQLDYLMWCYESGNKAIQGIPYVAKGIHTKLYKLNDGVDATKENLLNADNFTDQGSVWDNFDESMIQRGEKSLANNATPTMITEDAEASTNWGQPFPANMYIKNPDGSFIPFDRVAQSNFQTQCRNHCVNLHGNYNSNDAVALSQHWAGASILTMKKYLFGYGDKLYLGDRYSAADRQNIEGAVITWMKMMNYYCLNPKGLSKDMTPKVTAMGVPIILSLCGAYAGSSIVSSVCGLSYFLMSSALFKRNNKTQNSIINDGFSRAQINNLKRFDAEIKAAVILRTIAQLLSPALFSFKHDEDDDKFDSDEVSFGIKMDDYILKKFGYEDYLDNLEEEVTTGKKHKIRASAKTPGALYTLIKHSDMDEKVQANLLWAMGTIYYCVHRWDLEQSTLFPYDLEMDASNSWWQDIKSQASTYANVFPVGPSAELTLTSAALGALAGTTYDVPYNYDEEAETLADALSNYEDWNEAEIPKIMKLIRTGQYMIAKDNKGFNKLIQLIPYMNSIGVAEDPYKGAKSYDFGREMNR